MRQDASLEGARRLRKETGLARLLTYDAHRRASLQDYLLAPGDGPPSEAEPAWVAFPERACEAKVREETGGVLVELRTGAPVGDGRLELAKTIEVRSARSGLVAHYELRATRALVARFAVRWNLTLTGPAPDRYYRTDRGERLSLEDTGWRSARRLDLVDDWLGLTAALWWSRDGTVAWTPVYTVSLSESGFERIWQGVQVTVCWPVELGPKAWSARIALDLAAHRGTRP